MSSDDYRTDQWILDLFPNFFDPCPYKGIHLKDNGLHMSWNYADYDGVFVNPPYSNPKVWVEKAILEQHKANKFSNCNIYPDDYFQGSALTIVMLLKHDTSTEWYRLLHEAGAKFLLVNGRLKHQTAKACAFPSVLAVLT